MFPLSVLGAPRGWKGEIDELVVASDTLPGKITRYQVTSSPNESTYQHTPAVPGVARETILLFCLAATRCRPHTKKRIFADDDDSDVGGGGGGNGKNNIFIASSGHNHLFRSVRCKYHSNISLRFRDTTVGALIEIPVKWQICMWCPRGVV
ncbi:hypothetical protein E2C01_068835 [Portunus trituberculatus]|uniref:Uncharacterized protein n=1 Tax=Portunus trituberculatus TaxID=210409 RepID=A0A5B7HXA4_PORTR|nr:hypothetical protein [Portunus trituberculatus]